MIDFYSHPSPTFVSHHLAGFVQVAIIVGAAFATVLVGLSEVPKWIPAILSGVISATTGLASYFRLGERSRILTQAANDAKRESELFKRQRGPYRDRDQKAALEILRDQIDYIKTTHVQKLGSILNLWLFRTLILLANLPKTT